MNFVNISEQKESSRDARRDTWCVTNEVMYFDWLKKQRVNQVLSSERTIIYANVAVAPISPNLLKVRFCTVQYPLSLYICTLYLDVDMRYY